MTTGKIATRPTFRAPMAVAAVAFAGGIWMAGHLFPSVALWGAAGALLVLCAVVAVFFQSSTRLAHLCAVLALVCAGALARITEPTPHIVVPPPEFISGEPVQIEGYVINDGSLLGNAARERFDLQT